MTLTLWLFHALALFPQGVPTGGEFADTRASAPVPWWDGFLRLPVEAETGPAEPQEKRATVAQSRGQFVDMSRFEMDPRVSLLIFGGEAGADPEVGGGILARVPMPWLSPKTNFREDYFGLFLEFTISQMDRDLDPAPDDTSGTIFFVGAGVDYTFIRSDRWCVLGQAGFEYGNFGGIADTEDGVGFLLGGMGGLRLFKQVWVNYSPQLHFAVTGDWILFNSLGVIIQF